MSIKGNIEICVDTCFGPKRPVDRCNARTRRGTECQKNPMKGKKRCRIHGGASTGPRTARHTGFTWVRQFDRYPRKGPS